MDRKTEDYMHKLPQFYNCILPNWFGSRIWDTYCIKVLKRYFKSTHILWISWVGGVCHQKLCKHSSLAASSLYSIVRGVSDPSNWWNTLTYCISAWSCTNKSQIFNISVIVKHVKSLSSTKQSFQYHQAALTIFFGPGILWVSQNTPKSRDLCAHLPNWAPWVQNQPKKNSALRLPCWRGVM